MTIEQATEEMNQAAAALALAQQHLLEAAAEATQNLADIKKILGFEQPPLKVVPVVKNLQLEAPAENKKHAGRGPSRSVEEYQQELAELEKIENPTKQQTARKSQVRWLIRRKGGEPDASQTQPEEPAAEPQQEATPAPDLLEEPQDRYKVLVHEEGLWKVRTIKNGKAEAMEELKRLTFEGYEARIKRL